MPQQLGSLFIIFRFLENVSIVHNNFSKVFKFGGKLVSHNKSEGFFLKVEIVDRLLKLFETEECKCAEAYIY
jgi:hypothetical protein